MTHVQLRCYGGFSLEVDGQPLLLPTVKIRMLLIYLLFGPQRRYPRRTLASLFWPEVSEARGLANLSTALSLLRSRLPAGTLEYAADSRNVALLTAAISSDHADVAALSTAIAAHPHRAVERCPLCGELTAQAIGLMHGPWLDGIDLWECEELQYWLTIERERQRQQYITHTTALIGQYSLLGRHNDVISLAEQLLEHEPWQEDVLAALLRAHLARGTRAVGLARYRRFVDDLQRESGLEPGEPLQAAVSALRRGAVPSPRRLPAAVTLYGRGRELAQLTDWLVRNDRRLVTISGLGGVGKTTLALAAAARLAPWLRDGVQVVRLADVHDEADALIEIGRVLGVAFSSGAAPLERVIEWLTGRELLLVLDNVEQLTAADRLCAALLQRTDHLTVLVTSRRPLRLWQEQVLALQGFTAGTAADDEAARQLFTARVERTVGVELLPAPAAIDAICAAVGGLPLAIELAAAQLREQTAEQLLERLQHENEHLFSTAADLPMRQRRPAAILAQAYADLSDAETAALIGLSVTVGSFDNQTAAAAVLGQLPADRMIAQLFERGLVIERGSRREIHPLVRQFVQQQAPAEHLSAARRQHRDFWLAQLQAADLQVIDQQRRQRAQELGTQYGNLRTAWLQAAADDAPQLAGLIDALVIMLTCQGWFVAGAELLEQSAEVLHTPETAARCLLAAGRLWHQAGEFSRILPLIRRARRLHRSVRITAESAGIRAKALIEAGHYRRAERLATLGLQHCPPDDAALRIRLQYTRARALMWQARLSEAEEQYRLVLESARSSGNHGMAIDCLNALAQIPARNGDLAGSLPLLDAALAETELHGDPQAQITALVNVGAVRAVLQQEPATAVELLDRALQLARRVGNRRDLVSVLHSTAYGLIHLTQFTRAAELLAEGLTLALQIRHDAFVLEHIEGFGLLAAHQGDDARAQHLLSVVAGHAQTTPFVRQRARQTLAHYGLAETTAETPPDPYEFGRRLLDERLATA